MNNKIERMKVNKQVDISKLYIGKSPKTIIVVGDDFRTTLTATSAALSDLTDTLYFNCVNGNRLAIGYDEETRVYESVVECENLPNNQQLVVISLLSNKNDFSNGVFIYDKYNKVFTQNDPVKKGYIIELPESEVYAWNPVDINTHHALGVFSNYQF